ncbi:MAG: hypothetical protein IT454_18725 [Planctomycetes bacterium]|nr:hypothetical protein [Planctomycetota bacterium]
MPRPLRRLYPMSSMVRRRHRTWMLSMTLATGGAAVWGASLLWRKLDPAGAPSLLSTLMLSSAFTVPGTLLAFLSLRARTIWVLLAGIALTANGMMIVLPWIALRMRS